MMANPLYNPPANNVQMLMREAQNFRNQFKGSPRDEVQKLLNSGTMSQAEYNRLMPIAQQIAAMMPRHN